MKKLVLPSHLEVINALELFIDETVENHPEYRVSLGKISTALNEAVNNAIFHGNRNDPSKTVTLECNVLSDCIEFSVSDEGEGFNPDSIPDPTLPENIEKPEGRGIFLIRQLADQVRFENNGSTVIISFKA